MPPARKRSRRERRSVSGHTGSPARFLLSNLGIFRNGGRMRKLITRLATAGALTLGDLACRGAALVLGAAKQGEPRAMNVMSLRY